MASEPIKPPTPFITEEEQRVFQATTWGLDPSASWKDIRETARTRGQGMILFEFSDWEEAMELLYGPRLFTH